MRRSIVVGVTLLAGISSSAFAAGPTAAADQAVTVFSTESTPVTVYPNPKGCLKLSLAAHVLVNQTSSDVVIYSDPLCLTPGMTVPAGYGAHVMPGSGSFSA